MQVVPRAWMRRCREYASASQNTSSSTSVMSMYVYSPSLYAARVTRYLLPGNSNTSPSCGKKDISVTILPVFTVKRNITPSAGSSKNVEAASKTDDDDVNAF